MPDSLRQTHQAETSPGSHHVIEYIIAPPSRWVNVNWAELWRYRDLFLVMAWRDISVRYKQTALGAAWAILQPLINMILFTVIFNRVAHISSGDPKIPYPVFVYVGLLFWQFYSGALTNASNSMVINASMIQKVYFPRLIIPATAVTTGLVDMAVASIVLGGMMIVYHTPPSLIGIVIMPLLIVIAALASMGLGLFLAAINVKYRDVRHALPFFIQLLMYVTPVIYPVSMLNNYPTVKLIVVWLNPIGGVITTARAGLLGIGHLDPLLIGASFAGSIVLFICGLYYFRSTEKYFADIA